MLFKRTRQHFRHKHFWKLRLTNVSLFKVCGASWGILLSHHTPWQNQKQCPKVCNNCPAGSSKVFILHSIHQTGSFVRVCKKECSPHTLSNIFSEQNIRMSQGLVTSEASVLCFFCIYSFPVCASLLVSAESSSADESINRWKPVFQKIEWNEVKYLSNMQIWCLNHSSW